MAVLTQRWNHQFLCGSAAFLQFMISVWISTSMVESVMADSGTVEGRIVWQTSIRDDSVCPPTPEFWYYGETALGTAQLLASKKASAELSGRNCPQKTWYWDLVEMKILIPSPDDTFEAWGRSQYNGEVGPIGLISLVTICPSGERFGSRRPTCDYVCPAGQTWQGDRCAPRCVFGTLPNGICAPKSNGNTSTTCNGSNPINGATGNKVQFETDFMSEFQSFTWVRVYNSYAPQGDALGNSWRHSYARSLVDFNPELTRLYAVRPDGRRFVFYRTGHIWRSDADINDIITDHLDSNGFVTARSYKSEERREIETFNSAGQLTLIQSLTGRTFALAHDINNRLQSVIDTFGRKITFSYDTAGHISDMTVDGESAYRYKFDSAGNLISVTYPDGSIKTYVYNESTLTSGANLPFALTGIVDENKVRFASFAYDALGRATQSEHAGGASRYRFSFDSSQTVVTDPLGSSRTQTFEALLDMHRPSTQSQPAGSGCGPASSSITYDTNANVISRTDFNGHKTCYAYDLSRNLETQRVEGLASNTDCATALATPPAGARVIRIQWHPDWRLAVKIAEPKKITTTVYNGQGASCAPSSALVDGKPVAVVCKRTEQATTDDSGSQGFAATVTGSPRTWSYTYTTFGRVLTATDPNGQTTRTIYHPDDDTDLGKRGQISTVTNPAGHVTRYTDYNAHSQPIRTVDPNGLVTLLTYDLRQRLTSRKVGDELTTYRYDPVGQLTQITLPDGAELKYTYDAAHRLIGLADHKGNKIDYTLDAMGNRINEKLTDPSGALVKNIARSLDALNRVQQTVGSNP